MFLVNVSKEGSLLKSNWGSFLRLNSMDVNYCELGNYFICFLEYFFIKLEYIVYIGCFLFYSFWEIYCYWWLDGWSFKGEEFKVIGI